MIKKVIIISIALLFFLLLIFGYMEYYRRRSLKSYEEKILAYRYPSESALVKSLENQLEHERIQKVGRYVTFTGPSSANMFMIDTTEGRIWILVQDPKTKKLRWQRLEVEGEKEEEKRKIEMQ